MSYDPTKHHRRSIRLKGHDYAGGGVYFVTLCAHREFVAWAGGSPFGAAIGAAKMPPEQLPEPLDRCFSMRALMEEEMQKTARLLPWMKWGEWVIMPDHFHAIVTITAGNHGGLADVMTGFKAGVTRTIHRRGDIFVAQSPDIRVWQRDYYERILRSPEIEERVREYIRMNPWRCVQNLGGGLHGVGNPALWSAKKLGVLCSRNAPHIGHIPDAEVYLGGWHSPKEKEMLDWLLKQGRPVIACPAWGLECSAFPPGVREALEANRMLVLEMRNRDGDLSAAEERNRFVLEHADERFVPYVLAGGMLERLIHEFESKKG